MRTATLALAVGIASLILLPFVPILPGLGSLAAGLLGLSSYPVTRQRWIAIAAAVVGGLGAALALIQLFMAFLYPLIGSVR